MRTIKGKWFCRLFCMLCMPALLTVPALAQAESPEQGAADSAAAVAVVVDRQPDGTAYDTVVAQALESGGYSTLEAALGAAVSGQTVVMLQDYTMAQSAVIPAGVLVLLPCEGSYKAYESNGYPPDGTVSYPSTGSLGTLYRTLTIPTDITLTVHGDLLVNAITGRPASGHFDMDITGGYARIQLDGELVVSMGGKAEVCGLVTGGGLVTAQAGAKLFDLYIVRNWRGGSQAYTVTIGYDIFPMNEIDCHNIQTDICILSGATYAGTVKMFASGSYYYTRFPQIDPLNGLIRLKSGGYAIKRFDAERGRSSIELYGGAAFSRSTLNIVGLDLSTGSYLYPIDGEIDFTLNSGTYAVDEDFKLLTGCTVTAAADANIVISEGAGLVLYDEFHDVKNVSDTAYPERPPATLTLEGGAKLTVNGTFAGRVVGGASASAQNPAAVTFGAGSTLSASTLEANGYHAEQTDKETDTVTLTFLAELWTPGAKTGMDVSSDGAGSSYYFDGSAWSTERPSTLVGDLNGDGVVNVTDLSMLLGNYKQSGLGDINGDGTVNVADLGLLLGNYKKTV